MYAIIATGGKQYKVSEGDVIKVEKLGVAEGETVTFDKVLLVSDKETVVGNPTVANATVTASVVCEGKDMPSCCLCTRRWLVIANRKP